MNLGLSGKLALVSGSTAGIGFGIAKTLSLEGARVIVNGRTEARVKEAIRSIRSESSNAKLEEFTADLSSVEGADLAAARFPDVEILVNNLGTWKERAFEEITDAEWTAVIETNFMSGLRLSRHYLPRMKLRNSGRIIFISSESAINIEVSMIHYCVTKTMQLALARGLAELTAGTAVTINTILAGPTWSEGFELGIAKASKTRSMTRNELEMEFFRNVRPSSLLRRFANPGDVAAFVAFLASPLSSATNGAAIRVEGGIVRSIF